MKMLHVFCTFLIPLLFFTALGFFLPSTQLKYMLGDMSEASPTNQFSQDSFTLIMQTYKRSDLLLKLLKHYQALPRLKSIIVVWNEVGQEPPQKLWESYGPHPVHVYFKKQSANLVRNRMQLFPEIQTQAVLMMDDDFLLSSYDISFAFSVWQQLSGHIVGFIPRKHVASSSGNFCYESCKLQALNSDRVDKYSIILTGLSFINKKYLKLFQELPPSIHNLIDQTQNCDDIAMNFLVANYTLKPSGVLVKAIDMRNIELDAASGFKGLWHRPQHFLQRSYCINKLVSIYGKMPLIYSNIMITQFGSPNKAKH